MQRQNLERSFPKKLQSNSVLCRLVVQVSRSHIITHKHLVGLVRTNNQLVAETATYKTHHHHNNSNNNNINDTTITTTRG